MRKKTVLQHINQLLPPRISYSLRKGIKHESVASFSSYDEYRARRFSTHVSYAIPSRREERPYPSISASEKVSETPSESLQYRRFARTCIETGNPEQLLAAKSVIPHHLWLHPSFCRDYFIALISLGKFEEARIALRDMLVCGAIDQRTALRVFGEVYLLDDNRLLSSLLDYLMTSKNLQLENKEIIYIINTAMIYLGEDECLRYACKERLSYNSPDTFFFMSNLRRHRRDFAGQLTEFNRALALYGMEPVSFKNDSCGLSIANLYAPQNKVLWNGPLVSIAMSTFNSEKTLLPVLESLMAQTYRNIEVLIIDDCSTDETVALAKQFASREARVRVFQQPNNGGTYRARNRALREAKGKFFTCNDSDDWAHPTKIEELITPLLENPKLIATTGSLIRINIDVGIKPREKGYLHEDQSSLCYHREWAVRNLGFYEPVPFGADSEFLSRLRTVSGTSVTRIHKPLLFADWSKSSLTGSFRTGISDGGTMAPVRIKYRASYRQRHAAGQIFINIEE